MSRAAVIAIVIASNLAAAVGQARTITVAEAKILVAAAVPEKTKHLPKFGVEYFGEPEPSQFYFLTAYWAGAPNGSIVIGNYAVDRSTADVWDAAMECHEIQNPKLQSLQKSMRVRIGLSDPEYEKRKRKGPLCE